MKTSFKSLTWLVTLVIVGFNLTSCTTNLAPIPEAEYSNGILGKWQGTVGNLKETLYFKPDSTFVCELHPTGFISNTLSQGADGTVEGTWNINGSKLSLQITGVQNERLKNRMTTSTIVSFKQDEIILKSDSGETAAFLRIRNL